MRHAAVAPVALFGLLLLVPAWGCGSGGTTPPPGAPPFVNLTNFQPAAFVIGQPDFTSNMANQGGGAAANTTGRTGSVASGSLYAADPGNNRVLGYVVPPAVNDAPADFVLGHPDFISSAGGTSATQLLGPSYPRVFGGKLFLIDVLNHRVLIWNTLPTSNGAAADVVVGQPDFVTGTNGLSDSKFSQPSGITVAAGRLIVSDDLNNRILIWNAVPTTNGVAANVVIGQPDFASNMQNQGGGPQANTLARPAGIWSDGTRLFVCDSSNERVLIWNTIPVANNTPADLVLGQPDFTTSAAGAGAAGLNTPSDVDSNGTQLFVADLSNNRILVWNALPTVSSVPADVVLGQSNFVNTAPNDDDQDGAADAMPSARTFNPAGFFFYVRVIGNQVFVGDHFNHRTLVFNGL